MVYFTLVFACHSTDPVLGQQLQLQCVVRRPARHGRTSSSQTLYELVQHSKYTVGYCDLSTIDLKTL